MTIEELLKGKYAFAFFANGGVHIFFDTNHNYRFENWEDVIPILVTVDASKIYNIVHRPNKGFAVLKSDGDIFYTDTGETLEQLLERVTK